MYNLTNHSISLAGIIVLGQSMGRNQLLLEAKATQLQYCLNTKDKGNDRCD